MKKLLFLLPVFLFFFCFFSFSSVQAVENNKFGIHISQSQDLEKAAELVNSAGGDWGYVTIVIQENDQDKDKWQNFFDLCREKHLIPLVRLATYLNGDVWAKPSLSSISTWADFLDSLNWPVKNRYLLIFNEPNHAKEWGGEINPGEYTLILAEALKVLKKKNSDFFILNAGFDQATPNSKTTMEEAKFLTQMNAAVPEIFLQLDGWASHSYPNHGFVGKPWEKGKAAIKGYEWELSLLKNNFGLTRDLPVFISETGWTMKNEKSKIKNQKFYNQETVAEYTKQAFEDVWLKDKKVVAVTPFILNYPFYPFENFSWLDADGHPMPHYLSVQKITKVKGKPVQIEKYEAINVLLPSFLPANFVFRGKVILKNTGQSIWGEKPFVIKSQTLGVKTTDLTLTNGQLIKPGEIAEFDFLLETPSKDGDYLVSWGNLPPHSLKVFEAWSLTNKQESFFNKLFNNLLNLYYHLKAG